MHWITLAQLTATRALLSGRIHTTPTLAIETPTLGQIYPNTEFFFKMEQWQKGGTFKIRGALTRLLTTEPAPLGVTAASAGNHAIAVGLAAREIGIPAHLCIMNTASPLRVKMAEATGAQVELFEPGPQAYQAAQAIAEEKNYLFAHPFDGSAVTQATATIAAEMIEQSGGLDAIFVAIGGGGLSGGLAAGGKLLHPKLKVFGVEPRGANTMQQSFAAKQAVRSDQINTIADSLGTPMTTDYCYQINNDLLDHLVVVEDEDICAAMAVAEQDLKLAIEPAAATALAGLIVHADHFRPHLAHKKVGVLICGSNIDASTFAGYIERGLKRMTAPSTWLRRPPDLAFALAFLRQTGIQYGA